MDDEAEYACQLTLGELRQRGAKRITTIEGLSGPVADALRQAWIDCDVVQCGYCQSAQLIAAAHLLAQTRAPSDEAIKTAMSRVLCRCGTYPRILKAIGQAVSRLGRR
ncbi:[2Fe-2S] binding protein [Cupriavidus plantarum]|uniref:[2Fe-2S] binding protein n=1 Tax=Cupriavidus plantarum TaxID=942865 RepID=A0A316F352_9BURK|nr:[2Fe-2S] binding protein [Cupriavidus plantarum]